MSFVTVPERDAYRLRNATVPVALLTEPPPGVALSGDGLACVDVAVQDGRVSDPQPHLADRDPHQVLGRSRVQVAEEAGEQGRKPQQVHVAHEQLAGPLLAVAAHGIEPLRRPEQLDHRVTEGGQVARAVE